MSPKGFSKVFITIILAVVFVSASVLVYQQLLQPIEKTSEPISSFQERPSNISAYLWALHIQGRLQVRQNGDLIDLTNLLCSIQTFYKLNLDEERQLKELGVTIVRYTGHERHYYIVRFSILILPQLSELEFVEDVRSAWGSPSFESTGILDG